MHPPRRDSLRMGKVLLGGVLAGLWVSGCARDAAAPGSSRSFSPQPITDAEREVIAADTKFGFALFDELRKERPKGNVFFSPVSVALALTMTCNGAAGETRKAMEHALSLEGLSLEAANKANASLRSLLEHPDRGVDIALANSLWARKGCKFNRAFIATNRRFYRARVSELDFNSPKAPKIINAWVRKQTRKRITQIVDSPIEPDTVLFLINAVCFDGKWTTPFDEKETQPGPFTLLDGKKKRVPLMSRKAEFQYLEEDSFQAVQIPYGYGQAAMYLFLPSRDSSLDEFCKGLNAEQWDKWRAAFKEEEILLKVPRFTLAFGVKLNDALKALGMAVAFQAGAADFSAMSPSELWIHQVKHKAFVRVHEKGTEAAATTAVEMKMQMHSLGTKPMIVDRPFLCAIVHESTGAILFLGAIVDPHE